MSGDPPPAETHRTNDNTTTTAMAKPDGTPKPGQTEKKSKEKKYKSEVAATNSAEAKPEKPKNSKSEKGVESDRAESPEKFKSESSIQQDDSMDAPSTPRKKSRKRTLDDDEDPNARSLVTLFVRNLPDQFNTDKLEELFGEIGPLRSAFVVKGKDFGFVRWVCAGQWLRGLDANGSVDYFVCLILFVMLFVVVIGIRCPPTCGCRRLVARYRARFQTPIAIPLDYRILISFWPTILTHSCYYSLVWLAVSLVFSTSTFVSAPRVLALRLDEFDSFQFHHHQIRLSLMFTIISVRFGSGSRAWDMGSRLPFSDVLGRLHSDLRLTYFEFSMIWITESVGLVRRFGRALKWVGLAPKLNVIRLDRRKRSRFLRLSLFLSHSSPLRSTFRYALKEDAARAVDELHNSMQGDKKIRVEYALAKSKQMTKDQVHEVIGKTPKKAKIEAEGENKPTPKVKETPKGPRTIKVTTLLLSGLPADIDAKSIYKRVRKLVPALHHPVLHPRIVDHPFKNDVSKAVVQVPELTEGLAQVIHGKLDGHQIHGSKISCTVHATHVARKVRGKPTDWSLPENLDAIDKGPVIVNGVEVTKPRLIVRNLHFSTTTKHLTALFSPSPVSVTLPERKGFGFVEFATMEEAKRGLLKNGEKVLGRVVAVDWSLPKGVWEGVREADAVRGEEEGGDEEMEDAEEESEGESGEEDGVEVTVDASDSESDDSDDEERKEEKDDVRHKTDTDDGTTLFIRNLAFETTEDEIRETWVGLFDAGCCDVNLICFRSFRFKQFGRIRYARIVVDHATGKPRGTAFIRFLEPDSAKACLDSFALCAPPTRTRDEDNSKGPKSILNPEPALATPFHLNGRFLHVLPAVSRAKSEELGKQTRKELRTKDKRNVYLLREGLILAGTPAAEGLTKSELEKRQKGYDERKTSLEKNPNLFVSRTRLSVRNLWSKVGEKELGALARGAVKKFDEEVKAGLRDAVELDEAQEGERGRGVKQVKLLTDADRVDAEGNPTSKGIGFVEFRSHEEAIKCLRWLNNNPTCYELLDDKGEEEGGDKKKKEAKKRPIVEFAVENRVILKKREEKIGRAVRKTEGVVDKPKAVKDVKPPREDKGTKRKRDDEGDEAEKPKGGKKQRHERWNQSSKKRKTEEAGKDGDDKRKLREPKPSKPSKPAASATPAKPSTPAPKPAPKPKPVPASAPAKPAAGKKDKLPTLQAPASAPKKVSKERREEANFDAMVDRYKKSLFG